MIEWLNQNIGSDTATYLGTFLAIIALVFGGNKMVKKSQKQSVKYGNGIQAGGNVTINTDTKKDD
ncbi:hypothetical protein [Aliivibrio logei]|uniref:Uncharacterized protein n=1 Tax=Aliivibrio logei TaxID=688 RepID=A0A1B9NW73_ALILO|nr:hypothetical protein [Aliivibrio logei]OCH19286.1 hypothetical protein A6E04_16730 [Aliivibrio logei]